MKTLWAKEKFSNEHNREPTIKELSLMMNVSEEQIKTAVDSTSYPISLYEPVFHEGGEKAVVGDQIRDERNTDVSWIDNVSLEMAIEGLGKREQDIVNLRYFEGKTQMEVAEEVGISYSEKQVEFRRARGSRRGGIHI